MDWLETVCMLLLGISVGLLLFSRDKIIKVASALAIPFFIIALLTWQPSSGIPQAELDYLEHMTETVHDISEKYQELGHLLIAYDGDAQEIFFKTAEIQVDIDYAKSIPVPDSPRVMKMHLKILQALNDWEYGLILLETGIKNANVITLEQSQFYNQRGTTNMTSAMQEIESYLEEGKTRGR